MLGNDDKSGGADETGDDSVAFVVVRLGERTWVSELPRGVDTSIGSGQTAGIRVEESGLGLSVGTLRWDGEIVTLTAEPGATVFLGGKPFEGSEALKPGDEIAVGGAQLVVGISVPLTAGGRRALTHNEFRERLHEEIARATRGNRPTALIMVQARAGEGRAITATALGTFRAGDVVGSYANDAIELLLPDTDEDTAVAVMQRILTSGEHEAAAGVAVGPEHGDNGERLLRAARKALSQALRQGGGISPPPLRSRTAISPSVHDPATREVVEALENVAAADTPVFLTGEASTGKGLLARFIHDNSTRRIGPFVVIRCATINDDEDAKAAFGCHDECDEVEAAEARGGTLHLDEVGDLPPFAQKRLAALLERERSAIRLVSSTTRAVVGLVERGAFDAALYERLAGVVVELPPLRSRPEDILPLAERFAEESGAPRPVRLSPGAIARLRSYPWPGNVLELRNSMERAVQLAAGGEILAEHLPSDPIMPIDAKKGRLREHVDSVERDAIVKALADTNNNQTHAAKRLGISRRALIYKMEKYGLKRPPRARRSTPPPS